MRTQLGEAQQCTGHQQQAAATHATLALARVILAAAALSGIVACILVMTHQRCLQVLKRTI